MAHYSSGELSLLIFIIHDVYLVVSKQDILNEQDLMETPIFKTSH